MNRIIHPSKATGSITAPPSKSMAHRMLISAGLSSGNSVIDNISLSQDILATLDCLKALGADFTYDEKKMQICMTGIDFDRVPEAPALHTRESGSTLRFFIPICLLLNRTCTLSGSETLFTRPLSVYETIAKEEGFHFEKEGASLSVCGALKGKTYTVDGSVSSQFISGLLFALPLAEEDSEIRLLPPVESIPYIKMTVEALAIYGVHAEYLEQENRILIPGRQTYRAVHTAVEGDYSNAAFLDVFNYIGGDVQVNGLNPMSLQGDQIYKDHFPALSEGTPTLDISNCPDLGPILFTLAAMKHGAHFTGTRRLRIKESDRAMVMQEELRKFGIEIQVLENEVLIPDTDLHAPEMLLSGHNDHRIVMSLATLCSVYGGEIEGAEAVRKSFPDYFDVIRSINININ